jgi:hypothetical protein
LQESNHTPEKQTHFPKWFSAENISVENPFTPKQTHPWSFLAKYGVSNLTTNAA